MPIVLLDITRRQEKTAARLHQLATLLQIIYGSATRSGLTVIRLTHITQYREHCHSFTISDVIQPARLVYPPPPAMLNTMPSVPNGQFSFHQNSIKWASFRQNVRYPE
jgi:hypothetical protein